VKSVKSVVPYLFPQPPITLERLVSASIGKEEKKIRGRPLTSLISLISTKWWQVWYIYAWVLSSRHLGRRHDMNVMMWDPDIDLNGLGPLVRNPKNPSKLTRRRHHMLLDLLLLDASMKTIIEVRKILAAYPYLRSEYEPKIVLALERMRRMDDDDDDEEEEEEYRVMG
jgi:hypothetical protein